MRKHGECLFLRQVMLAKLPRKQNRIPCRWTNRRGHRLAVCRKLATA